MVTTNTMIYVVEETFVECTAVERRAAKHATKPSLRAVPQLGVARQLDKHVQADAKKNPGTTFHRFATCALLFRKNA